MLQRTILLSLLLLFGNISISLAQSTPVDAHGQLSVNGTRIVGQNGDTVQFQGMSLYWSNLWGSTDYYTPGALTEIRDHWCANIIRAAMGTSNSEGDPVNGGYLTDSATTMDRITNVVEGAIDSGMYVIIDWHGHHAYQNKNEALEFFSFMAEKYGSNPNVIYETFNEPLDTSWSNVIKPYHEDVIDTIRHYDPDNIIVCGTPRWCQNVDSAADDPITGRDNIMYTLHYYAGEHGQWLRDRAQDALNQGIPLFVTEYGNVNPDGGGAVSESEANSWYNFVRQNDIGYLNWSLTDQEEGSAALNDGAGANGDWSAHDLTSSGTFVRNHLTSNCPPYSSLDVNVSLTSPSSDTTVSGCDVSLTLEASASSAEDSIVSVEFFAGEQSLGADSSAPYSVTWNDVPTGQNSIRAVATNSKGEFSSTLFRNVVREKWMYTVSQSPEIDGSAEAVWSDHPEDSLSKVSVGDVSSASDLSVTYKSAYDQDSLYLFVDVTDDVKINDSNADYQDDAVDIFLDIGNDKRTSYGSGDYHFVYAWQSSGNGTMSVSEGNFNASAVNFAKTDAEGYYKVELAFSWSDLGLSDPSSGTKLGIDIQVNDDDNGGDRDAKVAWSDGDDNAWENPSAFGTATLKGSNSCVVSAVEKDGVSRPVINVYPNPFANYLNIQISENKSAKAVLVDINGRKMVTEDIKGENRLSLSGLQEGLYILRVKTGDNIYHYKVSKR